LLGLWTAGPLKIRGIHPVILAQLRFAINTTLLRY
jgi:hypothetical protein